MSRQRDVVVGHRARAALHLAIVIAVFLTSTVGATTPATADSTSILGANAVPTPAFTSGADGVKSFWWDEGGYSLEYRDSVAPWNCPDPDGCRYTLTLVGRTDRSGSEPPQRQVLVERTVRSGESLDFTMSGPLSMPGPLFSVRVVSDLVGPNGVGGLMSMGTTGLAPVRRYGVSGYVDRALHVAMRYHIYALADPCERFRTLPRPDPDAYSLCVPRYQALMQAGRTPEERLSDAPLYAFALAVRNAVGFEAFQGWVRDLIRRPYDPASSSTPPQRYVALGDSYSSGYGNPSYEPGTNRDGGPNNCQRSQSGAYAQEVRLSRQDLSFSFHACQGGITRDFFRPRDNPEDDDPFFSESAQLDNVDGRTGLVTFSIGGNDARFGPIMESCVQADPRNWAWGLCSNDASMTERLARTFQRLSGLVPPDGKVYSYDEIWQEVKLRAGGTVAGVSVGYPHFFPPGGNAAGCEGVYASDQAWMVERINELNDIARTQARKSGMRFADPNDPRLHQTFADHELCSNDPWIHPIFSGSGLHPGRVHPTAAGQRALAEAVKTALAEPPPPRYVVKPQQTVTQAIVVTSAQQSLNINTAWPGSDVVLTLRSPSGRVIGRETQAPDVSRTTHSTWERVEVLRPEVGTWTAELYGLDVMPDGEPTSLDVYQEPLSNKMPQARPTTRVEGAELVLDGQSSTDPDGRIVTYDWYIRSASGERKVSGAQVRIPRTGIQQAATLVVTDDRGGKSFAHKTIIPVDVLPGSAENPVNLTSKGTLPLALLSTPDFDATTVSPATLRAGPGAAAPVGTSTKREDVNMDGRQDLVAHFSTQGLRLTGTSRHLCVAGAVRVAGDVRSFEACDVVKPKG